MGGLPHNAPHDSANDLWERVRFVEYLGITVGAVAFCDNLACLHFTQALCDQSAIVFKYIRGVIDDGGLISIVDFSHD